MLRTSIFSRIENLWKPTRSRKFQIIVIFPIKNRILFEKFNEYRIFLWVSDFMPYFINVLFFEFLLFFGFFINFFKKIIFLKKIGKWWKSQFFPIRKQLFQLFPLKFHFKSFDFLWFFLKNPQWPSESPHFPQTPWLYFQSPFSLFSPYPSYPGLSFPWKAAFIE